ncbi:MAG: hypothetical protein EOM19_00830 [Candidatus Moranbacteria bacterium]|nr:hypothetical protein [Candidatus Moranbacteria bacterium]
MNVYIKFLSFFYKKKDFDTVWNSKGWHLSLLFLILSLPFFLSFLQNTSFPLLVLVFLFFAFLVMAILSPRSVFVLMIASASFEIINLLPQEWGFSLRPYQFLAGIIFLGLCIRNGYSFARQMHWNFSHIHFIDIGIILIVFGGFLSSFFSDFFVESIRLSIILLSFAFLYVLVRVFLKSTKDIVLVMPYMIASFVSTALYALIQNASFLHGMAWHKEIMPGRPNAFFSEPDWLGFYTALFLFVLWFLFFSTEKKKHGQRDRIVILIPLWIASSFGFMTLIITVSRSAWLGLFFGLSFLVVWSIWKQKKQSIGKIIFLILSFFVAILYVLILPLTTFELGNRAQSSISGLQEITISCISKVDLPTQIDSKEELIAYNCRHINLEEIEGEKASDRYITKIFRKDPNAEIRKDIWKKTKELIEKNFFFGIGWGGMSSAFGEGSRGEYFNASNLFLGIWLGSGIGGFIGLVMIFIYLGYFSIRSLFSKDRDTSKIGIGVLGTLVVVFVFNMFNSSEFLAVIWVWLGVVASLFLGREKRS